MNITIRNEEKKDISAIYNVNVEAFAGEAEAKIVDKLLLYSVYTSSWIEALRSDGDPGVRKRRDWLLPL